MAESICQHCEEKFHDWGDGFCPICLEDLTAESYENPYDETEPQLSSPTTKRNRLDPKTRSLLVRRLFSFLVDVFPVFACIWLVSYFLLGFDETFHRYCRFPESPWDDEAPIDFFKSQFLLLIQAFVFFLFYSTLLLSTPLRASIGKSIFGLEVVRIGGGRYAVLQFAIRTFFCATTFFSLLPKMWSNSAIAWHDQIAKTKVIFVQKYSVLYRSLLFFGYVAVFPSACALICIGLRFNLNLKQAEAVKSIKALGANVYLMDNGTSNNSKNIRLGSRSGTYYLRRWLGDDYFDRVCCVDYWHDSRIRDASLSYDEVNVLLLNASKIYRLRELNLVDVEVDDHQIDLIVNLRYLQSLHLLSSNISDKSLEKIARLPYLTELNISRTTISDRGIEVLKKMKNLKRLFLSGTKVSIEAADELNKSLPTLELLGPREMQGILDKALERQPK